MDISNAESFMRELIKRAPDYGFTDCAANYSEDSSMSIDILEGQVQSYERSSNVGITFKGKKNGQMSSASTSEFSEESLIFLLENTSANCEILDDEDEDFFYCDPENPTLKYSGRHESFSKNTYERFASLGLELEKKIFALSDVIKSVDYLNISCSSSLIMSINSKGLYLYRDEDDCSLFAEVRAVKDDVTKTCGNFWYGTDIDDFDDSKFLSKLYDDLMGKFGASPLPSGKYDIILLNEAVISLFGSFLGNMSAYSMQKGISLLAGKEGTKIASDILSIKEDPMYEKAISKAPFDGEGVLTYPKYLIEKGVFTNALYNLKSANKAGINSTGNGFGGGTRTTNLIIEPGELDFDGLCNKLDNGLIITELNGLHAGVNSISGDFSLFCEGYLVTNGKKSRSVEQITISDNFYNLINKISDIGNDIFTYPKGIGEYFFPSMIIKDIAVSGDSKEEE